MRSAPLVATLLAVSSAARAVQAEPEWNVAAQTSLCGLGAERVWQKIGFCGSIRGDLLLGRERNADWALGPYATFGSATFSDLRFGGGLSLLVPTPRG